ncbi:hypothetical protein [Rhizobium fabae]|uniref:Uncharacterized protein n=1 Tax=Rhizobium fabae TaxID=573179 RepID=A0A7W6B5W5_9HYPH|nr:hypothetical protein [Rhizobium fabae]MBB3915551.1 hypothetical protein [Rhizobium fabae]RUM11867.1 hypothetical protein EFB14_15880 [Rhizobium fabae]
MRKKTTTIRGLAFDIVVIETTQTDVIGTLFYHAEIYIRSRKTGEQKLARRSRIPGSGGAIATAVQQHGVRALEGFAT